MSDKPAQNASLTDAQKDVLFNGGTEPPFSGALLNEHGTGDFVCANCGAVVFKSGTKFESGSGWPSFYEPANAKAVHLVEDSSHGMQRVEVRCANCDAHLGHVFHDAPE